MNRTPLPPDDSWESDEVWDLLDQAPPREVSPAFLADTLRAARLEEPPPSLWRRLFPAVPLAGLAATTAAVAIFFSLGGPSLKQPATGQSVAIVQEPEAESTDSLAAIQDRAETEALMAAVDHLDQFSDRELVSLIGF